MLSVIGPRDARGNVVHPTRVVSVNEPCRDHGDPVPDTYEGVRVECAKFGEDYSRRSDRADPRRRAGDPPVPADAVTASGSGLDPNISPAYADTAGRPGWPRPAASAPTRSATRCVRNRDGRALGFMGEPRSTCSQLNLELDREYPVKS